MITFHLISWALYFNSNCYNTSDFYFNKSIFTQTKYNIPASIFYIDAEQNQKYIPNSKNASNDSNTCISIFDYGNIFLKSKTNVDEDKKENFRMKTVKKRPGFCNDSICHVEVYLPSMFCTCAVETVKSCILVVTLLVLLLIQVGVI